jgi:hypothetical protein
MENNIQRLYNLIKKFETDNNSKTTAVLFDNDYLKGWYRLMVSSECLDDLSPYESILELVKYIKENDPTLYHNLLFNISTVHTEDESMHKVRESFDEGVRYLNKAELFYNTLTNVYIMI